MKNFEKSIHNPLFGNEELGTAFDVYFTKIDTGYRMDFSWRKMKACAVTFSPDGLMWEEPKITLSYDESTGWEDRLNRNCVLFHEGKYKMWYTGQARGYSFIGYAESEDGLHFERVCKEPILIPEYPYEKQSVMNPCVLIEDGLYRMWYAAGETYEPNVLCYAESTDGIVWTKKRFNPLYVADTENFYEQDRVGGCQVVRHDGWYYMFYIGYEDIDTARICCARSRNGITEWQRSPLNPLVSPTKGGWDGDACYKPSVLFENGVWRLWYNGRCGKPEYVGMAEFDGDLFPEVAE
ncbi:MAG: hypothetical protein IJ939_04525 [Clostridia bacterium]|nr:hypothetical protein [Clostridia bacterium]